MHNTLRLEVGRDELQAAFTTLSKLVKRVKKGTQATLTFEPGVVTIDVAAAGVRVKGEGATSGGVAVPWERLAGIVRLVPNENPILVKVEHERLFIGSWSVPCSSAEALSEEVFLPPDTPLHLVLQLKLRYTEDQITRFGFADAIRKAERERDSLIAKAYEILRPLSVSQRDLTELVTHALSHPAQR